MGDGAQQQGAPLGPRRRMRKREAPAASSGISRYGRGRRCCLVFGVAASGGWVSKAHLNIFCRALFSVTGADVPILSVESPPETFFSRREHE